MGLCIMRCACGARLELVWSEAIQGYFWNCFLCFPKVPEMKVVLLSRR
jgi:hypothetical protein